MGRSETESAVSASFPVSTTIDQLYVHAETGNVSGTYTVMVNGAETELKCTLSAARTCSDTTHTVSIASGQTFSLKAVTAIAGGARVIQFRVRIH
jgi:hypothetical protein